MIWTVKAHFFLAKLSKRNRKKVKARIHQRIKINKLIIKTEKKSKKESYSRFDEENSKKKKTKKVWTDPKKMDFSKEKEKEKVFIIEKRRWRNCLKFATHSFT